MRLFKTTNGSTVYVDEVAKLAVSFVDCTPLEFAKLIEVPYSELALNDWEEIELDQFALTPLRNIETLSTSTIEVMAVKYLISQIPTV